MVGERVARSPRLPLIALQQSLSEITGPVFGHDMLQPLELLGHQFTNDVRDIWTIPIAGLVGTEPEVVAVTPDGRLTTAPGYEWEA